MAAGPRPDTTTTAAPSASDDLDLRSWRWRPAARRPAAAVATLALGGTTAWLVRGEFAPDQAAYGLLGAALLLALAGIVGRGNRGLATVLLLLSGGYATLGAWTLADALTWQPPARLAAVAAAVAVTLLLLGLFAPFGRAGVVGAAATVALTALWELAALAVASDPTSAPARLGAVLAVISVVLLGLLPRLALRSTGLMGIDARGSAGSSVSRHQVADALADTHRGLLLATVATACSTAAAGWLLTRAEPTVWTVLLTCLTALVLLTRARAFPLVVEVVAVFAAAAVLLVRLVALWLRHTGGIAPLALLALAAAAPLLALAFQPSEGLRHRLRRTADLAESTGVVALFPLAVGVFGVYGQLFGRA